MVFAVIFGMEIDLLQPLLHLVHKALAQSVLPKFIPFESLDKLPMGFRVKLVRNGHYFFFDFTLPKAAFFVSSHE